MACVGRGVALWLLLVVGAGFPPAPALAQPDPTEVLAAAKAASGGSAWDLLTTQHSTVSILTGGLAGAAERWSELTSGRSYLRYSLGSQSGAMGYDGTQVWSQDASGISRIESAEVAKELAANGAYRDQLAFWYPSRHAARMRYKERASADGADFDVVAITPIGGREFELWVNADTRLIERLVEPEPSATRTEIYMDWRDVQGVTIPFRVRLTRSDRRGDEIVVVDTMQFNASLADVPFGRPAPPKPDYVFPTGKSAVEVPFEIHSGHLYIRVAINGAAPVLLMLDAGAVNALTPESTRALGLAADDAVPAAGATEDSPEPSTVRATRLDIGGIVLEDQAFAVIPLADFMRRVEGLDEVAGLVGHELFKRFPIKVDHARFRAVIYHPAGFRYDGGGVRVPMRLMGRMPQVEGSVDGIGGFFDIDLGSRSALTLAAPFAQQNGFAERLNAKREVISGAGVGGYARALLARAQTLKLGDVTISNPLTYLSTATRGPFADPNRAGNVGNAILRRFDITFDFAQDALYFEANANNRLPEWQDRAGVWAERAAGGYVLVEVVPEGPAANAGLKAGDVVVAIDGKPVGSVSLSQFRQRLSAPPGSKVRLKLDGGATRIVTLRDLI